MFQEDSHANNILEITLAPSKRSANQIDDHYDILFDNGIVSTLLKNGLLVDPLKNLLVVSVGLGPRLLGCYESEVAESNKAMQCFTSQFVSPKWSLQWLTVAHF